MKKLEKADKIILVFVAIMLVVFLMIAVFDISSMVFPTETKTGIIVDKYSEIRTRGLFNTNTEYLILLDNGREFNLGRVEWIDIEIGDLYSYTGLKP